VPHRDCSQAKETTV